MDSNTLQDAISFLSKDKKIYELITKFERPKLQMSNDYFGDLSKSIIYQQLSGKVANVIYNRFLDLFDDRSPECVATLDLNEDRLKDIGLSRQKVDYIKGLSSFFINRVDLPDFSSLNEEDVRSELVSVKGIGDWTVDMFLMFTLCRTDILPYGDLGIKKGFQILFNLSKIPDRNFMESNSESWRPYRTIASCYLWRLVDESDN